MSSHVITWPAPAGEIPSADYTVEVDGCAVFVYQARVRAEILQKTGLWSHQPDCPGESASFAMFDIDAPISVTVQVARPFSTAAVLPARAGIIPVIDGQCIQFTLERPQHLTLLLDGSDQIPLHLFINEPETDIPEPDDPEVIYFAPGVHEVHTLSLHSGQTLYLAGGAVLQASLSPEDHGVYNEKWDCVFYSGAVVNVSEVHDVRICGRGILDASRIPHPGKPMLAIRASEAVQVSGIMLRDAANWNVIIDGSRQVCVENISLVSGRLNSDGINSVNSQQVRIRNCFVRNHDDSIAIKATDPEGQSGEDILVEDCCIWNDWGYALGVTYETRRPISRVTYRHNDILFARHWCFGVRVCDSGTVSDINFLDTWIADPRRGELAQDSPYNMMGNAPVLLQMSIVEDCWGNDQQRGHIRDVTVDGVKIFSERTFATEIYGYDDEHDIRNVTLRNIRLHGQPALTDAAALRLTCNDFVHDIRIEAEEPTASSVE